MERQIICGLALSLMVAASSYGVPQQAGMAQTRSERQVTIRIFNYAQVKPSALLTAERIAGEAFREAGLDVVWVECFDGRNSSSDAVCATPVTPVELIVKLLPRLMAERLQLRGEVFGFAVETTEEDFGCLAFVFCDRVKDFTLKEEVDLAPLLGDVIAHELGHLLLGAKSHSHHGLMGARWSGKQLQIVKQGGLSFSASESKQLQISMTDRSLATHVSGTSKVGK